MPTGLQGFQSHSGLDVNNVQQEKREEASSGRSYLDQVGTGIKKGVSSAWDVLSGERDWRRQKGLQEKAWEREDSSYQRLTADLEAAGINPMMAGQLGGSPTSAPVARSHSAESVGRILSMAGGVASGSAGVMKTLTELGSIKANTAHTLADTARIVSHTPAGLSKLIAETALSNALSTESGARIPLHSAHTVESKARTNQANVRTSQMKAEMPRFHAEADYYKRYGRGAVLARENRNPWQSSQLMAHPVGNSLQAAVNSASTVMAKAAGNLERSSAKQKQYRRHQSSYYVRR